MTTTTPKSNNAKTKTQAKVKNSATSSPAKQPLKKKVVKLHPILAGFTKQGKR